jgi:hypothetical protein
LIGFGGERDEVCMPEGFTLGSLGDLNYRSNYLRQR